MPNEALAIYNGCNINPFLSLLELLLGLYHHTFFTAPLCLQWASALSDIKTALLDFA